MNEYGYGSDLIKLADVWGVLVRRRRAALAGFLAFAAAAGLYLLLITPLFESSASIYIGAARDSLLVEPTLVSQRIERDFGKNARRGASAWVSEITSDRRDPRLIRLKVRGTSPKETLQLATQIVEQVVSEHATRLQQINEAAENELRDLKDLSGMARTALNRIKTKETAGQGPSAPEVLYSTVQLGSMVARIGQLEQVLHEGLVRTEVVQAPALPRHPVRPVVGMVVALTLLGGPILALVAAFLAEAVARRRGA
jgi:uncharacterized protein involved in exopolysaccharide biosynthesis